MQYRLVRSKRKSLAIEINKNLEIIVRAPLFLSKRKIDEFVSSHERWAENAAQRIKENRKNLPAPLTEEEILKLKKEAKEYLPNRVEYFSALTGLFPTAVKITSAKTRFGSCSAKNSICFSYLLMRHPKSAVDYVVLHELCHIKHKNHSRDFYALVEKHMPDYKEREKGLKTPISCN